MSPELQAVVERLNHLEDVVQERDALRRRVDKLERSLRATAQRYLTVREAVTYTGISDRALRRKVAAGELTGHFPIDRLMFDRTELDAMFRESAGRQSKRRPPRKG